MEIFQPIRNRLAVIGLELYQKTPFNLKNMTTLFMLIMGSIFCGSHLFFVANNFKEYADSFCASSSIIVSAIIHTILLWKIRPLYRCLNDLEKSVTKREFESFESIESF